MTTTTLAPPTLVTPALSYEEFLASKAQVAEPSGFPDLNESHINPALKPHQRDAVAWAVRGGRRAIFASFGLGKTAIQLETIRLTMAHVGPQARGLIVLPLGVRQEFTRDARNLLGIDPPTFIRSHTEATGPGMYMTNYESVRDGKLDPTGFDAVSLDEAAILRGFGGTKTFRELMRRYEGSSAYRFVATATPSPNDYIELLSYAAFLDILDVGQAKAQPLDAKVLTPAGWRCMGDLSVGDSVIAVDGLPTQVIGVYPQDEQQIYRVTFSDGSSTEATGDHLWLTQTQVERNYERRFGTRREGVRTTDEIARTLTYRGGKNHSIPTVEPVSISHSEVEIDPWLLGLLLGDGTLRDTSVGFATVDKWIVREVEARIGSLSVREVPGDGCDYTITSTGKKGGNGPGSNPILTALRHYGLTGKRSPEKFIPDDFLINDIETRLAVLQGLMDSDGTVAKDGTQVKHCTTSERLAAGVREIVYSLGGTARTRRVKTSGLDAFLTTVRLPVGTNPFRLPRKANLVREWTKYPPRRFVVAVELIGVKRAQCIAVEDPRRLYVTDDYVVTHNTRFFKRDSEHADTLTLLPHMEHEFWMWVSSWALFLNKPSDLGHSDEGYILPDIEVHWHEIPAADIDEIKFDRDGRAELFRDASLGVQAAAAEKRASIDARVARMRDIVAGAAPGEHFLLWHDQEAERHAIADTLPITTWNRWHEYRDGHPRALELYERHYSAYQYADGRERRLFMGPGEKTVLLTADGDALFGWRKFRDDSGQSGVCCSVFRNEGADLSSDLIREAMAIAWQRWPGERLYTYVDASKVASPNPGYCFLKAGWSRAGRTKGGLIILEALPGSADVPDIAPTAALRSVWGAQDLDEREARIIGFSDGEYPYLSTKPVIAGSGCNFQRHCHRAIFVGIGFKFADFIQAIHRIHRFGQTHPVRIDLIYTSAEASIRAKLERKWRNHEHLVARMTDIIREHGITADAIRGGLKRTGAPEKQEVTIDAGRDITARLILGDSVIQLRDIPDDSIGQIVTSIPFSTQYEYSPSTHDFGHNEDNAAFWQQMDYLTPELVRVLQPGRVACIHVKDRIVPGGINGLGFRTLHPFHAEALTHYQRHGLAFLGMVTVVTDVVRENNQTYRLSYTQMTKDGSSMGVGVPEYILILRKPQTDTSTGYADERIVKEKDDYTLGRWQVDAHGFWRTPGNRHLLPEEFAGLRHDEIFRLFRDHNLTNLYDFDDHVALADHLREAGKLPVDFMLLQPPSWHPDVWTDVARMRTLNMIQAVKGKEQHLCPLQFDVVDRCIERWSNPGDTILDPFGGIMTVPYCATKLGRPSIAVELNPVYWRDGVAHVQGIADQLSAPTLFDVLDLEEAS